MSIETAIIEIDNNRKVITTKKLTPTERESYNKDEVKFLCCECSQYLIISISNRGKVHLKHKPKSQNCILKSTDESDKELIEEINQINYSRESDRHKELKHKIASKLSSVEGVTDIEVEKTIISKNGDWRRPDVSCIYNGNKIGFEVQLSSISQRYVLRRKEFYDNNGIYLIWILDGFNKKSQNQTEKDIKYLKLQQSIFSVNESDSNELLKCQYKEQFIKDFEIHEKWTSKLINLQDIIFDENLEFYFYNLKKIRQKLKIELAELKKQEEIKKQRIAEEKEIILQQEVNNQKTNELKGNINSYKNKIKDLERINSNEYVSDLILRLKDKIELDNSLSNTAYYSYNDDFTTSFERVKEIYKVIISIIRQYFFLERQIEREKEIINKLKELKTLKRKGFNQITYSVFNPREDFFIEEEDLHETAYCAKKTSFFKEQVLEVYGQNYNRDKLNPKQQKLKESFDESWKIALRRTSDCIFFVNLESTVKKYSSDISYYQECIERIRIDANDNKKLLLLEHQKWKQQETEQFLKKITEAENELKELK